MQYYLYSNQDPQCSKSDVEVKAPSVESLELTNVHLLNCGALGHNVAMHASYTVRNLYISGPFTFVLFLQIISLLLICIGLG